MSEKINAPKEVVDIIKDGNSRPKIAIDELHRLFNKYIDEIITDENDIKEYIVPLLRSSVQLIQGYGLFEKIMADDKRFNKLSMALLEYKATSHFIASIASYHDHDNQLIESDDDDDYEYSSKDCEAVLNRFVTRLAGNSIDPDFGKYKFQTALIKAVENIKSDNMHINLMKQGLEADIGEPVINILEDFIDVITIAYSPGKAWGRLRKLAKLYFKLGSIKTVAITFREFWQSTPSNYKRAHVFKAHDPADKYGSQASFDCIAAYAYNPKAAQYVIAIDPKEGSSGLSIRAIQYILVYVNCYSEFTRFIPSTSWLSVNSSAKKYFQTLEDHHFTSPASGGAIDPLYARWDTSFTTKVEKNENELEEEDG